MHSGELERLLLSRREEFDDVYISCEISIGSLTEHVTGCVGLGDDTASTRLFISPWLITKVQYSKRQSRVGLEAVYLSNDLTPTLTDDQVSGRASMQAPSH